VRPQTGILLGNDFSLQRGYGGAVGDREAGQKKKKKTVEKRALILVIGGKWQGRHRELQEGRGARKKWALTDLER